MSHFSGLYARHNLNFNRVGKSKPEFNSKLNQERLLSVMEFEFFKELQMIGYIGSQRCEVFI